MWRPGQGGDDLGELPTTHSWRCDPLIWQVITITSSGSFEAAFISNDNPALHTRS